MQESAFAQSERRSLLAPILIALAVLAAVAAGLYLYLPHHTADITVTHIAVLPTHTVFENDANVKVLDHHQQTEDDLYVLATVRIEDKLRIPLFLSDLTATFITADDAVATTSAIQKNDLPAVTTAFPAIQRLTGPPLLRESTIQPHIPAEGMVILRFPLTQAEWNKRKSATLTVTFYHHTPITIPLPKE